MNARRIGNDNLMTTQATAPAKIILCGEHAVVYGSPAIAIPLSQLRVTATIHTTDKIFQIMSLQTGETLTLVDHADHPFVVLCLGICQQLNGLRIEIDSAVPPGSGFGSGAAVATAIVRVLYAYMSQTVSLDEINALVYKTEQYFHGTPSGIDNTVIVHEKPIFFVKDQGFEPFFVGKPLNFVIANSGSKAATRETVGAVRERHQAEPQATQALFNRISEIGRAARAAIADGNPYVLGPLLTENHDLLKKLDVSSDKLNRLVEAALQAGALGAKLSGAGRGGNMIALVTDETQVSVLSALQKAGAHAVYETVLS
jgi:mevalonate kinase